MSIFHSVKAVCSHCGHANAVQRTASVNADRRPSLRAAILDGSFQQERCTSCDTLLRLPPHLTYLDMARKQWFMVESAEAIVHWQDAESRARTSWDRAFGSRATPHARDMGRGMQCRLVLGWPALREKLIAAELGLDDLALEMCKLGLLQDMEDAPLADQTELRLVAGQDDAIVLSWFELATERTLASFEVPRSRYDEIIEQAEDWAELRTRFDDALLVDWRRLMFAPA